MGRLRLRRSGEAFSVLPRWPTRLLGTARVGGRRAEWRWWSLSRIGSSRSMRWCLAAYWRWSLRSAALTGGRPLFPSTCLRMGAARSLTPSRAWAHQRPQRCTPGVTCVCSYMHRETMASAMMGNDSKPFWHAGGRARLLTGGSPGEAAPHRHPLISWRSRAGTLGHGARRLLGTVASPTMPSARHGARLSFALLGRCACRRPCGVCPPRPGLTCVAVTPTWGRSLACDRTGTSRGARPPPALVPLRRRSRRTTQPSLACKMTGTGRRLVLAAALRCGCPGKPYPV